MSFLLFENFSVRQPLLTQKLAWHLAPAESDFDPLHQSLFANRNAPPETDLQETPNFFGNRSRREPGALVNRVARANLANSNLAQNNNSDRQFCGGPRLGWKRLRILFQPTRPNDGRKMWDKKISRNKGVASLIKRSLIRLAEIFFDLSVSLRLMSRFWRCRAVEPDD
jgi:hypothetical protein